MVLKISKKLTADQLGFDSKGDLLSSNGSNVELIELGEQSQMLRVNLSKASGLEWVTDPNQPQDFTEDKQASFTINQSFNNKVIPINTNFNDINVTLVDTVTQGFQVVLYNLGSKKIIINPNGQNIRSRGLEIVNINSVATLSYDKNNLRWYAIGDLI